MNAEEMVTVTVKLDAQLLEKIDLRVKELDLNRSQYFRKLARTDLVEDVMNQNGQAHQVENNKAA